MNNVIKGRSDHQILSLPGEIKLFQNIYKGQILQVILAIQGRGDSDLDPRVKARFSRTTEEWKAMSPEQQTEHLRRFFRGLPPERKTIDSRCNRVKLSSKLKKVAKKINQTKAAKRATTTSFPKKRGGQTMNDVPVKKKRLQPKKKPVDKSKSKDGNKKKNPRNRKEPPPKKPSPLKGPTAKKTAEKGFQHLSSNDEEGEDVMHSQRHSQEKNPEFRPRPSVWDNTDTDSNASPVKPASKKSRTVTISSSESDNPGSDIPDISEPDQDIEVTPVPPVRTTRFGRELRTPGWQLSSSERERRRERQETAKQNTEPAEEFDDMGFGLFD